MDFPFASFSGELERVFGRRLPAVYSSDRRGHPPFIVLDERRGCASNGRHIQGVAAAAFLDAGFRRAELGELFDEVSPQRRFAAACRVSEDGDEAIPLIVSRARFNSLR